MKKLTVLFGSIALILFTSFQSEDPITYSLDKAHSRLGFKIKHMGIVDINGEFNKFDVKINLNNG
ncbi:MAG: YceI family protein, partial [Crocinitomicaceae bacterium]